MIEIKELKRQYRRDADTLTVLDGIDLMIEKGSFTAVLGRNGCGKSTLAKHINVILRPQSGSVTVDGMDTRDEDLVYNIRERAGMVFQDPDSQAVASTVEDDIAFAPENLGLDEDETERRIRFALDALKIDGLRRKTISTLSGRQKQLAAIAGILAMRPGYMIFDESTSMLDPASRKRILDCVTKLRDEYGVSVIWITHYMDEAARADRVLIIDKGKIAADGSPETVFLDTELIERCGLELPQCARLCLMLKKAGYDLPRLALDARDLAEMAAGMLGMGGGK